MGTFPLTLHGKVSQVSPFIRHGIVSSVYPFPTANPHGFTIDIMQQGGSSGSPIFGPDNKRVIGMVWGGVPATNISLAESAHIIDGRSKTCRRASHWLTLLSDPGRTQEARPDACQLEQFDVGIMA